MSADSNAFIEDLIAALRRHMTNEMEPREIEELHLRALEWLACSISIFAGSSEMKMRRAVHSGVKTAARARS